MSGMITKDMAEGAATTITGTCIRAIGFRADVKVTDNCSWLTGRGMMASGKKTSAKAREFFGAVLTRRVMKGSLKRG